MKIILSGYMGSGKSEVGRLLSADLNLSFKDLDHEIEQQEDMSVEQIFSKKGEIYFRKREAQVLQEVLTEEDDLVLALGGGTPCYGNNINRIKETPGATLFYLKTGIDELTQRLFEEKEKRPLIATLGSKEILEDFIRKHLFERTYYYNQSDFIITTDHKSPVLISEEIKQKLN